MLAEFDLQRRQLVHRGSLENQRLDVLSLYRGFRLVGIRQQRFLRQPGFDRGQIDAAQGSPEIKIDRPIAKLIPFQVGPHDTAQPAIEELQLGLDCICILLARLIAAKADKVGGDQRPAVAMAEFPKFHFLGAACRAAGGVIAGEAPYL